MFMLKIVRKSVPKLLTLYTENSCVGIKKSSKSENDSPLYLEEAIAIFKEEREDMALIF